MSETPEMVKRVAQAMAAAEGFDDADRVVKVYVPLARAAIEAMREPELRMVQAACDATFGPIPLSPEAAHMIGWRAMIDAALSQPTSSTA